MYKIEWRPKALRQLTKVTERKIRVSIFNAVGNLTKWSDCKNVKALKNRPGYRLRVGKWRVIFEVFQTIRIIEIKEVKKRDESTY